MSYNDDDDQDDDDSQTDSDDQDDSQGQDDQPSDGGASAVSNAPDHVVDAHRNMLGSALDNLKNQGVDVESLAEKAGVSSSDMDELSNGDLASMTSYLSANHPEVLQAAASRFPAAQGLLSSLTSGGGGFLGKFLG